MNPICRRRLAPVALCAAITVFSGCAQFSADGGMDAVTRYARDRTGGHAPVAVVGDASRQRTAELLAEPLTADTAVQVALLNHRGLQADLAELGIAEADRVQAGRLRGPSLRYGRLAGGGVLEIDRGALFDLTALIAMPVASAAARENVEQVQLRAAASAVALAGAVRAAWIDAVAERELLAHRRQAQDAADAAAELASRMLAAGNISRLAQLREQAFSAGGAEQLARSAAQADAANERLSRLLGIAAPYTLPDALPALPTARPAAEASWPAAIEQRLDVLLARRRAAAVVATTLPFGLSAGWQNESHRGEPRRDGWEVELELPLFDFGAVRSARLQARRNQADHHAAQVAADAASQLRSAALASAAAHAAAARHRDDWLPLKRRIASESLLRYNGMLIGVFELMADAREQSAAVVAATEALRDYWLADSRWQAALAGAPAGDAP